MLLRRRAPGIDRRPADPSKGFEHLDQAAVAVIRWLNANHLDYVLVGPMARTIRGEPGESGPVAIVPAPYRRNYERLARALWSTHARLRVDAEDGKPDTLPAKMTAEKLARGQRWTLRCSAYDLDIEGHPEGGARYQELLYEAARFELSRDVAVEVASPEDIERYAHIRRTGTAPEIRITREAPAPAAPHEESGGSSGGARLEGLG
jgi:hypothetical protein